ncbi:MAG TPA: acyl-ACP thioesterase domain-containing protein [Acidimicrobiales bacterium]
MSDSDTEPSFVPLPSTGRRFSRSREVRLGDATLRGRLRLDALARYLQDVANDDAREVLGEAANPWVVRRTELEVERWPALGETVELTTFCGGTGGRWAERRTTVRGDRGGHVEAASLWVHVDMATGRPAPLPPGFVETWGEPYGTRRVSGRLVHPAPPADAPSGAWVFRATDYDVMGHVNNAAYWAVAEEVLDRDPEVVVGGAGFRAELEYRLPVEPHHVVDVVRDGEHVWITAPQGVHASIRLAARPLASPP